MKIKCLFGFHIYHYLDLANESFERRSCLNCNKKQIGEYDMSFGKIVWRKQNKGEEL